MKRNRLLMDQTAADFAGLPKGLHQFNLIDSYGECAPVKLDIDSTTKKVVSASFDMHGTSWDIKEERREVLSEKLPRDQGHAHIGPVCIDIKVRREHLAEWLYQSAQFLSDFENLKCPHGHEQFAETIRRENLSVNKQSLWAEPPNK